MLHSMYMCHSSPLGCSMKMSRHCGGLFHCVTTYMLYNHDNSVLSKNAPFFIIFSKVLKT